MSKVKKKNRDLFIFLTILEYVFLGLLIISFIVMFEYVIEYYYYKFLDLTMIYELLDIFLGYEKKSMDSIWNMSFINNANIVGEVSFGVWTIINVVKFSLMYSELNIVFSISICVLTAMFVSYAHTILGLWMVCAMMTVPMIYSYRASEYDCKRSKKSFGM